MKIEQRLVVFTRSDNGANETLRTLDGWQIKWPLREQPGVLNGIATKVSYPIQTEAEQLPWTPEQRQGVLDRRAAEGWRCVDQILDAAGGVLAFFEKV